MRIFLQDGTVVDAGVEEWVILELSDRDKLNIQGMNVNNAFFATFPPGMKNGAMQDILEDAIQTGGLRDKGIFITKGESAPDNGDAGEDGDASEDELDENDTPNIDSAGETPQPDNGSRTPDDGI